MAAAHEALDMGKVKYTALYVYVYRVNPIYMNVYVCVACVCVAYLCN